MRMPMLEPLSVKTTYHKQAIANLCKWCISEIIQTLFYLHFIVLLLELRSIIKWQFLLCA